MHLVIALLTKWYSLTQDCFNGTTINAFKCHIQKLLEPETKSSFCYSGVSLCSCTYAISCNVVGGFGEYISPGILGNIINNVISM